jgi:hypothetical protein
MPNIDIVKRREITAAILLDILKFSSSLITGSFIQETIMAITKGAKKGNKYFIEKYITANMTIINTSFLTALWYFTHNSIVYPPISYTTYIINLYREVNLKYI